MVIVFLDFDGVLNSQGSFILEGRRREKDPSIETEVSNTLCQVCTSNFQYLLDKNPDMEIVISSMWRTVFDLEWLKAKLAEYGVDSSRVIDKTPDFGHYNSRGNEISAWLKDHPEVTTYIVLDDNENGITESHSKNFLQTSWETGLTFEHTLKALDLLKKLKNEDSLKYTE